MCCFMEATNQRRQYMAVIRVVVVARPVEVSGHQADRIKAMLLAQGFAGFDASDLMARPEMRQAETRNQAAMVSDPYREANMMAAEKTNPMNAASQEPGKSFLMKFIGK